MTLIFDTETTGKALFHLPPEHPSQPRMASLACGLFDDDGSAVSKVSLLIKPDGWTMPEEAAAVHGLTTEILARFGVPAWCAMSVFMQLAEASQRFVAFNLQFDRFILEIEHVRDFPDGDWIFTPKPCHCAMLQAKDRCKLPGRYGDYKWPKLSEAHAHFFGVPHHGAHDALADVEATAKVWFEMRRLDELEKKL